MRSAFGALNDSPVAGIPGGPSPEPDFPNAAELVFLNVCLHPVGQNLRLWRSKSHAKSAPGEIARQRPHPAKTGPNRAGMGKRQPRGATRDAGKPFEGQPNPRSPAKGGVINRALRTDFRVPEDLHCGALPLHTRDCFFCLSDRPFQMLTFPCQAQRLAMATLRIAGSRANDDHPLSPLMIYSAA